MKYQISGYIDWDFPQIIKEIKDRYYNHKNKYVNLVDFFKELKEIYNENTLFSYSYYISDIPMTKNEITEAFLKVFYGGLESDYKEYTIDYSSVTYGEIDSETTLKIGGHDLFKELESNRNKYIIIEIKTHELKSL